MKLQTMTILARRSLYDLTHSDALRWPLRASLMVIARVVGAFSAATGSGGLKGLKYKLLFTASRLDAEMLPVIAREIELYLADIDNLMPRGEYSKKVSLRRSIILKKPLVAEGVEREKGVLLLKFTNTFEYYIRHIDLEKLLLDYYLVLEPSWSGYCDPRILYWMKHRLHGVVIQAPEPRDYDLIRKLHSNLVPAAFGASDWVNDRIFHPLDVPKKYDAVYVAVYGNYKRHHVLFRALRALHDPTLRVALIGGQWMGTRREIDLLIDHYGVRGNIEIFENIGQDEVNKVLNMSKVSLLLSRLEGSNKAVSESLFAGVPVIVLKNSIGVQDKYINPMTGMRIDEKDLPKIITHFRHNWHLYNPREWAAKNISAQVTTARLNDILRGMAINDQQPWTSDIAVKVNAPELYYYHDMDEAKMLECGRIIEEGYELRQAGSYHLGREGS